MLPERAHTNFPCPGSLQGGRLPARDPSQARGDNVEDAGWEKMNFATLLWRLLRFCGQAKCYKMPVSRPRSSEQEAQQGNALPLEMLTPLGSGVSTYDLSEQPGAQ